MQMQEMSLKTFIRTLCIICTTVVVSNADGVRNYCVDNDIIGTKYTKEEIEMFNSDSSIANLAVSHYNGNIYIRVLTDKFFIFIKSKRVIEQLDTENFGVYAMAVDNLHAKVYLGFISGLRVYDEVTGNLTVVPEIKHWFNQLFIPVNSSELYAVKSHENTVYHYEKIPADGVTLNNIVIQGYFSRLLIADEERNIYYKTEEHGNVVLKILLKGSSTPITYEGGMLNNLAIDNRGRVFGTVSVPTNSSTEKGMYRVNPRATEKQLATPLDFIADCLCFDENNNPVFARWRNKITVYKYNDACVSSPTLGAIYDTMSQNMKNELNKRIAELNKTQSIENLNKYNALLEQNKAMREDLNKISSQYSELIKNMNITKKKQK